MEIQKPDTIELPVTGLSHWVEDYDQFTASLQRGEKAILIHEPNNAYDEHAIGVFVRRRQVGYVGRDYSHAVHDMIGERRTVALVIGGEGKSFRITLSTQGVELPQAETPEGYRDKLEPGVLGPRNYASILPAEREMELITMELNEEVELWHHGQGSLETITTLLEDFASHYGRSLCMEDEYYGERFRHLAKEIIAMGTENALSEDQRTRLQAAYDRMFRMHKDLGKAEIRGEVMNQQIHDIVENESQPGRYMEHFYRYAFGELPPGQLPAPDVLDRVVNDIVRWLYRQLDGTLQGFLGRSDEMSGKLLYAHLSRAELYKVYSHFIALLVLSQDSATPIQETTSELTTETPAELPQLPPEDLWDRVEPLLMKLEPLVRVKSNREPMDDFLGRWKRLLDIVEPSKQPSVRKGVKEIVSLLTIARPRCKADPETGLIMVTLENLLGAIAEQGYLEAENMAGIAKTLYGPDCAEKCWKNMDRTLTASYFSDDARSAVKSIFP